MENKEKDYKDLSILGREFISKEDFIKMAEI